MYIPKLIAHRGLSTDAPENTFAAFNLAETKGFQMFECDVQLSRDDVPVIFHDEKLNRTTNGRGRVRETDFKTLQNLDAGSWFGTEFKGERIPSLAELLAWLSEHQIAMNLELKGEDGAILDNRLLAEIVADMLKPYLPHLQERLLISSFQYEALEAFKAKCPSLSLGLLVSEKQFKKLGFAGLKEQFTALQATSINPALKLINEKNLAGFHAICDTIIVYTVDIHRAQAVLDKGVSAVFTNG